MAATLGPSDNCQLWPEWQVPMCGAILIQTGQKVQLPYWALSWLRIQCINVQLPEWPQLAIASLGPEWPKSAVYHIPVKEPHSSLMVRDIVHY